MRSNRSLTHEFHFHNFAQIFIVHQFLSVARMRRKKKCQSKLLKPVYKVRMWYWHASNWTPVAHKWFFFIVSIWICVSHLRLCECYERIEFAARLCHRVSITASSVCVCVFFWFISHSLNICHICRWTTHMVISIHQSGRLNRIS